jgi:hypothetical protein
VTAGKHADEEHATRCVYARSEEPQRAWARASRLVRRCAACWSAGRR